VHHFNKGLIHSPSGKLFKPILSPFLFVCGTLLLIRIRGEVPEAAPAPF
jgi:hypothetical protein